MFEGLKSLGLGGKYVYGTPWTRHVQVVSKWDLRFIFCPGMTETERLCEIAYPSVFG